jgi:glycerol dehydrogenase-like iron-containing ADH family enzyme
MSDTSNPGNRVSVPHVFLRGKDALSQLGENLEPNVKCIVVIAGEKALASCKEKLELTLASIEHVDFAWYGGEVTFKNRDKLVAICNEQQPDTIIAVGGGKAIDMGKWVAHQLSLPVVTIPTIAATCSAVSSVSIVYDDDGGYVDMIKFPVAPSMVVMDSSIISSSPKQWLAAGLGDTLAKMYEFRSLTDSIPECSFNASASANGNLCYELIRSYGAQAIEDIQQNKPSAAIENVMDAIFIFAGFTSIMGIGDHVSAAHGLFEGFTINSKTRDFGHGLLVGFGNLVLLELEGRSHEEIRREKKLARSCSIPVSIDQIESLSDDELMAICHHAVGTHDMKILPFDVSAQRLFDAIHTVSDL